MLISLATKTRIFICLKRSVWGFCTEFTNVMPTWKSQKIGSLLSSFIWNTLGPSSRPSFYRLCSNQKETRPLLTESCSSSKSHSPASATSTDKTFKLLRSWYSIGTAYWKSVWINLGSHCLAATKVSTISNYTPRKPDTTSRNSSFPWYNLRLFLSTKWNPPIPS